MERFCEPAYPTVYFSKLIFVQCPKCGELAIVETKLPEATIPFPRGYQSQCQCLSCSFNQSDETKWFGYVQAFVNRGCRRCGSYIQYISEPTRKPYEKVKVLCDTCQSEREYNLTWYRSVMANATDPYFGFDLWLRLEIKDHLLWLYNLEHLRYLKCYLSARLREDNGRHKYSMIANLPSWVKLAKNRDSIVRKLTKLETKITSRLET